VEFIPATRRLKIAEREAHPKRAVHLDGGTRSGCSFSLGVSRDATREIDVRKSEREAPLPGSLVLSSLGFDKLPLDRRRFSLTFKPGCFSLFSSFFFYDTFPGFLNAENRILLAESLAMALAPCIVHRASSRLDVVLSSISLIFL